MLSFREGYTTIERVCSDGVADWYIGKKNGKWYTWDNRFDLSPLYVGHSREEALSRVREAVAVWRAHIGV